MLPVYTPGLHFPSDAASPTLARRTQRETFSSRISLTPPLRPAQGPVSPPTPVGALITSPSRSPTASKTTTAGGRASPLHAGILAHWARPRPQPAPTWRQPATLPKAGRTPWLTAGADDSIDEGESPGPTHWHHLPPRRLRTGNEPPTAMNTATQPSPRSHGHPTTTAQRPRNRSPPVPRPAPPTAETGTTPANPPTGRRQACRSPRLDAEAAPPHPWATHGEATPRQPLPRPDRPGEERSGVPPPGDDAHRPA